MSGAHEADIALRKEGLLVEARLELRDEADRQIGLARFELLRRLRRQRTLADPRLRGRRAKNLPANFVSIVGDLGDARLGRYDGATPS